MNITVCNGKGGVGKSTISVLLTLLLNESGIRTGLVDRDPQATATRWLIEADKKELLDPKGHEHFVIDTPPNLRAIQFSQSVQQADRVVIVCSPSPADLWTTKDSVEAVESYKKSEATVCLLFNRAKTNTSLARGIDELARAIGVPRLPVIIGDRQAFQHAALNGLDGLNNEAIEELGLAVKGIFA